MSKLLEGAVVIVTGGASGLGRATCERFAEDGAKAVIIADLSSEPREGGESSAELVAKHGAEARFVSCDVTKAEDVKRAIEAADEFGGVTALVTYAGILQNDDLFDIDEQALDKILSINVKGSFLIAQAAARSMVDSGRPGSITLISSIGGLRGSGDSVAYCVTKGAVKLMAYAMGDRLARHGIRVNVLHPGVIKTAMTAGVELKDLGWHVSADRIGEPSDVANAAVYLASPLASYVNSTSLSVDGGMFNVL